MAPNAVCRMVLCLSGQTQTRTERLPCVSPLGEQRMDEWLVGGVDRMVSPFTSLLYASVASRSPLHAPIVLPACSATAQAALLTLGLQSIIYLSIYLKASYPGE